ncbi:MAG: proline--tRNA ligase [Gammaproteobacteria bacterium]|nr:MAG: proline--tRNA ligase [Gammaproteobacteria bacterium]
MRLSRLPLNTLKEVPADAEVVSHQLMLRAGLIRKLAAGLFTWMPLGLKVLRKVEAIVREEMDRAGAFELLMPAVQPAELWRESGRWDVYGDLLLRIRDRHDREFCFGPTHEEVITDIARRELKSYRQLPVSYYQIQTKFRDEIRPRFGVMRAREFLMKDAYSFHLDQASLEATYQRMAEAYARIFTRLGLRFRAVEADSGEIGGARSQEFHVLAESGEDAIAWCEHDDFAANVELAPALPPPGPRPAPTAELTRVATPGARSIDEVSELLGVPPSRCLKTLLVQASDGGCVALVLRGDHELNPLKAERLPQVAAPLALATAEQVQAATGCEPGFLGPVGLQLPLIADHAAAAGADFVCGANEVDAHYTGFNWGRDAPEPETADLRNIVAGDPSPLGGGPVSIARGIEVGHIFQLGDKYSRALQATVLDRDGREVPMIMGCYGIGVSRIVAAAIEQNHDEQGIIWPEPMCPLEVMLVVLNPKKSESVTAAAERLYEDLSRAGIEVLMDDRDARPGVKFADADLVGLPHRLTLGQRGLDAGVVEYRERRSGAEEQVPIDAVVDFIRQRLERTA